MQVDRKNEFYAIDGLWFPHWEDTNGILQNTVIDGELVIDEDPTTHQQHLRFYGFDCLVIQGDNLMQKNLKSRYGVRYLSHPVKQQLMTTASAELGD